LTIKAKTEEYGYLVCHEDTEYQLRKAANLWEVYSDDEFLGKFKQIKAAKDFIENLNCELVEEDTKESAGLWDCIPPAVHMVLMLKELNRSTTKQEKNTLDCCGFLAEDGSPDINQANRHLERFKNQ